MKQQLEKFNKMLPSIGGNSSSYKQLREGGDEEEDADGESKRFVVSDTPSDEEDMNIHAISNSVTTNHDNLDAGQTGMYLFH
jgi:hypothetical protein